MKQNKLIAAMALSLTLALTSCSDDESKVTQDNATKTVAKVVAPKLVKKQTSNLYQFIPSDTPILVAYAQDKAHPLPQNFKNKMNKMYSKVGDVIEMALSDKLDTVTDEAKKVEIQAFKDKWLSEDGIKKLGLNIEENEVAIYMVDLFPVFRMTLAKSHQLGELFDDLIAKANESKPASATKRNVKGHNIYQFGDKEIQVMVSLDNNSLVASLAPSREVDNLMPKLLGFNKPVKNITQSSDYKNTLKKYKYINNNLYWINFRQLGDYFVNPSQHKTAMLDILKVQDNVMSADCKSEILGMLDNFPRLVGGSRVFDEHLLDSHMIIEMKNGIGAKLSKIAGRIPTAIGNPALSYGFSFDIAAAKNVAKEFVNELSATPYKCEYFSSINSQVSAIKAQLDQPLPPFVGNFKGFNLSIDNLDLDFTKTDPQEMIKDLKANVLLAVDNPESLLGMAQMMVPDIQKLGLKKGAGAVNVSDLIPVKGTMMPINLDHVFLAMGSDTIGFSLGENTNTALTKAVTSNSTSDLLSFSINADFYKNIFDGISKMGTDLPGEFKKQMNMQKLMLNDMLWWEKESGSIGFTNDGFELNVDIAY